MSRQAQAEARAAFVADCIGEGLTAQQAAERASVAWGAPVTKSTINGIAYRAGLHFPGQKKIPPKGDDKLVPVHGSIKRETRAHLEQLAESRGISISQVVGSLLDEFAADDLAANGKPASEAAE